jgi:hypothetical protein
MLFKIRSTLANFFGTIAGISWILLILCFLMLDYVGVKIQYVLVPIALVSTSLWWFVHPDKKNALNDE